MLPNCHPPFHTTFLGDYRLSLGMKEKTPIPSNPTDRHADPDTEETPGEYLARHVSNQVDLKNAITFLIHRRELLRDCEIEMLELHCAKLIEQIADTKHKIVLEELECFKEVITLHKRLLQNDKS